MHDPTNSGTAAHQGEQLAELREAYDKKHITTGEYIAILEERESRKPFGGWTETEVENLVTRVSERVMKNFYTDVGEVAIKRGLQLLGMFVMAGLIWLAGGKFRWWG